jgi:hypothetical protein
VNTSIENHWLIQVDIVRDIVADSVANNVFLSERTVSKKPFTTQRRPAEFGVGLDQPFIAEFEALTRPRQVH